MGGTQDDREGTGAEGLSNEGVGMGMSDEGTTFEPEEDPAAVDEEERALQAQDGGDTDRALTYDEEVDRSRDALGEPESAVTYGEDISTTNEQRDELDDDEHRG